MNKKVVISIGFAAVLSILIGMTFVWIATGTLSHSKSLYIWNIGYSLTIGLSLFGNGYFFRMFAKRFINWVEQPGVSVFRAVLFHFSYSSLVILGVNWVWFGVVLNRTWEKFVEYGGIETLLGEYFIMFVITLIIYTISFFKSWKYNLMEAEGLKREALHLKYKVLQEQVNPHFLFNSLNVLESLIDLNTDRAKQFVGELSGFYRGVLEIKDQEIIPLQEELDLVRKYVYLQQIRFGESLQTEIKSDLSDDAFVIPLSVQSLVENAIKHNEISRERPLSIIVSTDDAGKLVVRNNIQHKNTQDVSNGTGLKSLADRYEFLTGNKIKVQADGTEYMVEIPLIETV
ncbi:histidine kinase [Puteibacter caeruleilacunae]|nr:histidine kinase [Puteibacter caeruleilacunae]